MTLALQVRNATSRAGNAPTASPKGVSGGQGYANATIAFDLKDGGGNIHTNAQITGKAASMGEGVVSGVLDALVKDFAGKLGKL